ncbi:hypothetical protein [Emticicia sp. BO119]|uniref:hypothetical protein n=1 Tax=Emticicia sp. BO119 TaxID=2757768 RepID=UPI0015F02C69|nr:hypothetical protein [Emticicia sp. BO119]MBA4850490.1 hypothetical protein [Emticicia sp. BO119]
MDKAAPLEKEYGLVYGPKVGVSAALGKSLRINRVLVRAGFARCGVGISYRLNMIIKPVIGQEALWETSIGTEYGLNASGNVGPMFKAGRKHLMIKA